MIKHVKNTKKVFKTVKQFIYNNDKGVGQPNDDDAWEEI